MPYTAIVLSAKSVVNVASVRHLSPFRYPGGKTWLVPRVVSWVKSFGKAPKFFFEPFAGGGIVGLTVALEQLAEHVVLAELDDDVASVWKTIFGRDYKWLLEEILQFEMSRDEVISRLSKPAKSTRERAFQTILRNRTQRGGILARGASLMLNGEAGRGIAWRWYPQTLAARIELLHGIRDRITFIHGDAFHLLGKWSEQGDTLWFVDPPYTAGGKSAGSRLYNLNTVDHSRLFVGIAGVRGGAMLTYDNTDEVIGLAKLHEFNIESVAMKNTHHAIMSELVVTKDSASVPADARVAAAKFLGRRPDETVSACRQGQLFA